MIDRRQLTALGLAAGACLAAPAVLRAQTRTISWATHPAILGATGDGELLKKFEAQSGIAGCASQTTGPKLNSEMNQLIIPNSPCHIRRKTNATTSGVVMIGATITVRKKRLA